MKCKHTNNKHKAFFPCGICLVLNLPLMWVTEHIMLFDILLSAVTFSDLKNLTICLSRYAYINKHTRVDNKELLLVLNIVVNLAFLWLSIDHLLKIMEEAYASNIDLRMNLRGREVAYFVPIFMFGLVYKWLISYLPLEISRFLVLFKIFMHW